MVKFFQILALGLAFSGAAYAQAETCDHLKTTAAEDLQTACASDEDLSLSQTEGFAEVSDAVEGDCGDQAFADGLARGVLYKNLDLSENCNDQAETLAQNR